MKSTWMTHQMEDMLKYIMDELEEKIIGELFDQRDKGELAVKIDNEWENGFNPTIRITPLSELEKDCQHEKVWRGTGKCSRCHKKTKNRKLKDCKDGHRWVRNGKVDYDGEIFPTQFCLCETCGLGIPPTALSPYRTQFTVPEMACGCYLRELKPGLKRPTTSDGKHCFICKGEIA